jgi:hypothetical protein
LHRAPAEFVDEIAVTGDPSDLDTAQDLTARSAKPTEVDATPESGIDARGAQPVERERWIE